ncbi:MAG TPA: methylated-DNA--[protein]-cysteine S-methyltransferase [Candidatus Limnocylindrales bacterium]|nr:methylated-DNA--[protein]-cysteine S-methyltransferase [Candidatus Limnocylindrales bacterium]
MNANVTNLEADLRELRVSAPPAVARRALVAVGLADEYASVASPIGDVLVAWNGRGVSFVARAGDDTEFERRFVAEVGRPLARADAVPDRLANAIRRRLGGDRRAAVPLDLRNRTPFEVAVWRKALEIPRGEVRPYGWIAAEIGRPKAVRAVGSALGHNPVPLVVPCHRVVRGDGTIGQYSMGGPEVKRRVLTSEGVDVDALVDLASRGVRYVGSDTTRIVCHPTCHQARRIQPAHRVPFRSLAAAAADGYRPCRSCRPVAVAA